jgi:hypothetical protein
MGHKTNGHTTPLDQRIAATLASEVVDKGELVSLLEEAHAALDLATAVIEAETPRLHDLSNTDPDASLDLIKRSKLRAERLEVAIPKLRNRISAIELYEYAQAWHAKADELAHERDFLAQELKEIYPGVIEQLRDLFYQIDTNAAAIGQLHRSAPAGEHRRLLDAELTARGLTNYDAAHPRLRENLKLPDFIRASVIAFPPDLTAELNRRVVQMSEAMRQRMVANMRLLRDLIGLRDATFRLGRKRRSLRSVMQNSKRRTPRARLSTRRV